MQSLAESDREQRALGDSFYFLEGQLEYSERILAMAKSRIGSMPWIRRESGAWTSQPGDGSMPNSVTPPPGDVMGHAEKRTPQPIGISELNGSPPPPPVRAPIMLTFGRVFITETKSFAALKQLRLVSTAIGRFR